MRESVAWALVKAWERNWQVARVVAAAPWVEEGGCDYPSILKELGCDYLREGMRGKVFMASRFKPLNDALWDGVPKAEVVALLMVTKAAARPKVSSKQRVDLKKEDKRQGRTRTIRARSLDKRHDWGTVK